MDRIETSTKAFIAVRDKLKSSGHTQAFLMSYKKPRLFYLNHSKDEAVQILINEADELIRSIESKK